MPTIETHHLTVGDSFTLCNQFGKHLHVIVAEASPDDEALLMLVYISSAKKQETHRSHNHYTARRTSFRR